MELKATKPKRSVASKLLDRAVALSKPILALSAGLHACVERVKLMQVDLGELARTVKDAVENLALVAQNQHVHHQMIMQLISNQQGMFSMLKEHSLDTRMPDIDVNGSNDDPVNKPN